MSKYVYPAIFTPEENGMFSVDFPDLEGCYTCGEDLAEALYMAEDVLAFTLYDYEKEKKTIPNPSSRDTLELKDGEFVNLIACDTLEYQKRNNNRALTDPAKTGGCSTMFGRDWKRQWEEIKKSKKNS